MAGHSKWSKIKHKKEAVDAKKSKLFSKLVRLIAVESKRAKGDRGAPGLRLAVERARAVNMPSENIERAIAKGGAGEEGSEPILYEAYGPGGAALLIETLTDNRNRTAAELKHALSEEGAALTGPRGALWAFVKTDDGWKPSVEVPLSPEDKGRLETLIEILENHDDVQNVFTNAR